ncbi:filamentous hemagglutinin N-terminal domain-containing protein [Campylobacter sp. LMG 17559]|uniref:filamentous hemagglutinin N-terminal domain-containing protein n=1 Tax=Campylobacter sp. LMG 17559 TaxID=2735748 RepID=UPI00301DCB2E|nr:filamentous hemagglutinin N-terminal domain-containing protein [Campylobacter sp. LMG 17559]
MKKLANHIILSGVTVSMLFSPLMALPSGGKFTHGTSGKIETSGNTMNITGTTASGNHVIQWGGGFNIGAGERVNFKGDGQNYLNIAHGTGKSTIKNILDAGGNNVFLINPNGVIIEKSGSIINANRFVASTSSMSDGDMWKFAKSTQAQAAAFSPVFKPHKAGNVVNMGNINAKNVTLQGNKVMLSADTNWDKEHNGIKFGKVNAENINLEGNEVYVNVAGVNANKIQSINVDAKTKGSMYLNASGYYYNPDSFKVFNKIIKKNGNFKVDKYVGIGSVQDWWYFAKGWNENKEGFRDTASEYRLTANIDFKKQNYANYWFDLNGDGKKDANEYTSMIVGYDNKNYFNKIFDGQGFTLSNINIDTTSLENKPEYLGIFGVLRAATLKNLNVDYNQGNIIGSNDGIIYAGGMAGMIMDGSDVSNITLKGIKEIKAESKNHISYVGGFAGIITDWGGDLDDWDGVDCYDDIWCYMKGSSFNNIALRDIGKIYGKGDLAYVGGFTGGLWSGVYNYSNIGHKFDNIVLHNIDSIMAETDTERARVGGFVGLIFNSTQGDFSGDRINEFNHIVLNDIDLIQAKNNGTYDNTDLPIWIKDDANAGGFVGYSGGQNYYSNIVLNNIKNIHSQSIEKAETSYAGGFMAYSASTGQIFSNIVLNNIGSVIADGTGYMDGKTRAGGFVAVDDEDKDFFKNIYIFFSPDTKIEANAKEGKKYAGLFHAVSSTDSKHENIFIYHPENIKEQGSIAPIVELKKISYKNGEHQAKYTEFRNQINKDLKDYGLHEDKDGYFSFNTDFKVKPSEDIFRPDVEKIKDETATLDQGDLISKDIWDYIIKDIDKVHYNIDIRLLAKLLSEYSDISNKTEDEQVKFVTTYLGVKENDARALLQSLSFLNAYKDHDISKAKFTNETVKASFVKSFENADTKFKDFNKNKNKLYNNLNDLNKNIVSKGFDIEYLLDENQEKLAKFIKAYNDYIVLIEKGLKNENDPAFINIKNTIIKLNNEAKNLYAQLLDYKDQLQYFKDNNEFKKVIIAGDFKTIPLLITPDVNKPINGGGEDGDYEKISRQIADSQKQTPTFEYEEEETEEVEESAFKQKGKTCIVSDNYKTMNPCVVGGL